MKRIYFDCGGGGKSTLSDNDALNEIYKILASKG